MSAGLEVKKPIRFFFFFGLFLAFVLLGVRACNERQTKQEVAEVEKILNENKRDLVPSKNQDLSPNEISVDEQIRNAKNNLMDSNSKELGAFESSKKPSIKIKAKSESGKKTTLNIVKDTSKAVINVRPKKSKDIKSVKEKTVVAKKEVQKKVEKKVVKAPIKKAEKKIVGQKSSYAVRMRILVSGQGYKLDAISQAKLKGAIKLNSKPGKVKVLVFSDDSQGRSLVVKRAELKSALIRAGLSTSTNIVFETVSGTGYAELIFY